MYGVNKLAGEVQGEIHHIVVSKEKSNAISEEKLVTSKEVTTSEEVDTCATFLDDMKEAVVTIRDNYLNKFEGRSTGSTGWFNLDHEWFF